MEFHDFSSMEECEAFFSKIDDDLDYAFALSLQNEYNEKITDKAEKVNQKSYLSKTSVPEPLGIVDEQWEFIDPNPDIHALFLQYNKRFFYGKLEGVEVKWSPRMTLCAGVCSYEGRGGLCSVRLSLPLLKLRPRRDLVETLLHEMIHAYLFVTANNKDHDAHGPEFLKHMNRINKETGTRISVYHSFHDEVDVYRTHWWKCDGPCQKRRPFFGLVKRASNRAPGPRDLWWAQHQTSCGGTFIKIKEPENYKNKSLKRKPLKDANNQSMNMNKFLKFSKPENSKSGASSSTSSSSKMKTSNIKTILSEEDNVVHILDSNPKPPPTKEITIDAFSGHGVKLGSSSSSAPMSLLAKIRKEIKSSDSKHLSPQQQKSFQHKSVSMTSSKTIGHSNGNIGASSHMPTSQKIQSELLKSPNLKQSSIRSFVWSSSSDSSRESEPEQRNNQTNSSKVQCPVCFKSFTNSEINTHLDICLQK